ncbi:DNA repair helicase [Cryphonectria parasitica EP155]|uniref:ATP-dependent DNA helicase CHL1 n=1 Tax=Cryphonectria parasitica (strain ATCC 38755 / EP155) TaxID=660469 RepID=A0A9P4Y075_CRYP1|nr:DNA repair helicase [Cryphonectria parasitica EP155]KAF3763990.1 DNA repair helicase [Cryphonectria parasitica EP155]
MGPLDDQTLSHYDIDFHHPFSPYDVQLEFMKAAYETLERGSGQVGILESPTGTGKSLSLICASMTWLRNFKQRQFAASLQIDAKEAEGEPDWIIEQMLKRKKDELMRKWEEREERLEMIRQREKQMEERSSKRRRLQGSSSKARPAEEEEEAEFLLDDWEANAQDGGLDDQDPLSSLSKETRAILQKVGVDKIYYASRTHSQLTQFIAELRRPHFQPSISEELGDKNSNSGPAGQEPVKQIPLSSRQKLCINPAVSKLASLSAINDRCSELQKPKSETRCPFGPSADNLAEFHQFRDEALATLPDIEDLCQLGKKHQVCPYYASRTAIPAAEIVTLPYPLLLQDSAREALGIKLEGNIVIVDEAHNIMDAVASVHAAEIRLNDLKRARQMLGVYYKRFGKKLKGENRIMVAQVVKVIDGLAEWLTACLSASTEHGIVESNALMKGKGVDQINMYKLIKYIQESKLAFKVESYASHVEESNTDTGEGKASPSSPVLHSLVAFIIALTNPSDEGRIFFEKVAATASISNDVKLSYLLLSPVHAFSSIAKSARAVILAGGTMSPFEDYKTHLFPYLSPESITTLSCGHVIPPSNLCVWTLASMKPNTTDASDLFEFSFQKRSDKAMIAKLGQALLNMCSIVPDGVVVFFPSYGYLDEVIATWQVADSARSGNSIWDRLQTRKAVFRDSKGASSNEVLEAYSRAILGSGDDRTDTKSTTRGALLLSVVGGKMSEGINFSDRLGRCVVIVGLPYPNINSPEWKARIEYLESDTVRRLTSQNPDIKKQQAMAQAKQVSRDFYENSCMRAVNQSIGRAIRHKGDYAAIVLVDRRFSTERIRGKLPGWIRGGMAQGSEGKGMQGLMGALNVFFKGKKTTS